MYRAAQFLFLKLKWDDELQSKEILPARVVPTKSRDDAIKNKKGVFPMNSLLILITQGKEKMAINKGVSSPQQTNTN